MGSGEARRGSSSIGDAKSQILNEPKDMVAFYDSRSPRLDFAAFNCSSKSAEENLDGYHWAATSHERSAFSLSKSWYDGLNESIGRGEGAGTVKLR